jgi:hypothetical protein
MHQRQRQARGRQIGDQLWQVVREPVRGGQLVRRRPAATGFPEAS